MVIQPAHHGGAAWGSESGDVIDADVLDAWFDPCPGVLSVLQERPGWLSRTSPPADGAIGRDAVSEARRVDPATIVLGAGSSDLIYRAMLRLVSPADRVLVLDPGYSEYPHLLGNVIGCDVHTHTLERQTQFKIDLDRLREDAKGRRWIVLTNPNNPAGQYLSKRELLDFIDGLPSDTWVWLDEAYLEYVEGSKSLERDISRRNLIVLRSLSKTLALSGLRAAYLAAPLAIASQLRSITPPWAISLPAQLAVRAALSEGSYYEHRYRETARLRTSFANRLREIEDLEVIEGAANWILVFLASSMPSAAEACASLAARGLFIRDASRTSHALGDQAIRIAVKDEATNCRIAEILRSELS